MANNAYHGPLTYEALNIFLGPDHSRKVQHNTYLERRWPDKIAVRLHGTDIAHFDSDGTFAWNTGGYETVTTQDRLNEWNPLVGLRFSRKGGIIHLVHADTGKPLN